MSSKIEQIISEIEDYINCCKVQPLSKRNVIVNKDEIEELLTLLRLKIPDEIRQYKKVVANRAAILDDAERKADEIIKEAKKKANELVSEHEIVKQAYIQAAEIVRKAKNEV